MPAGRASRRFAPLVLSVAPLVRCVAGSLNRAGFHIHSIHGVRWRDAVELRPILYIKLSLVTESATEGVCMTRCSCD